MKKRYTAYILLFCAILTACQQNSPANVEKQEKQEQTSKSTATPTALTQQPEELSEGTVIREIPADEQHPFANMTKDEIASGMLRCYPGKDTVLTQEQVEQYVEMIRNIKITQEIVPYELAGMYADFDLLRRGNDNSDEIKGVTHISVYGHTTSGHTTAFVDLNNKTYITDFTQEQIEAIDRLVEKIQEPPRESIPRTLSYLDEKFLPSIDGVTEMQDKEATLQWLTSEEELNAALSSIGRGDLGIEDVLAYYKEASAGTEDYNERWFQNRTILMLKFFGYTDKSYRIEELTKADGIFQITIAAEFDSADMAVEDVGAYHAILFSLDKGTVPKDMEWGIEIWD